MAAARSGAGGVEYVLLTNAVATHESLVTFAEKIMPYVDATLAPAKPKRAAAQG